MFGASSTRAIAVASIGNGSVSLALVERTDTSFSLLSNTSRVLPAEMREPEQTTAALKEALLQMGRDTSQRSAHASQITSVYCVVRAPWSEVQIAHTEVSFPEERHISESVITDLARQTLGESRDHGRFLDASVAQIALNGYPTDQPEGKRAHRVRLTALISSCEPATRKAALQSFEALFPGRTVLFRSGTRAILEALSPVRSENVDRLVLDIGHDGTAAVVIRSGAPEQESYLAEGMTSILQRAAPEANPEETLSALRLMNRDECNTEACLRIQSGFAKMEPELAHVFGEFFGKLIVEHRLPEEIVLITHPDLAPWLSHFFTRIDFTQFTETARPFSCNVVSSADLAARFSKDADILSDTDLGIALALINKELQSV